MSVRDAMTIIDETSAVPSPGRMMEGEKPEFFSAANCGLGSDAKGGELLGLGLESRRYRVTTSCWRHGASIAPHSSATDPALAPSDDHAPGAGLKTASSMFSSRARVCSRSRSGGWITQHQALPFRGGQEGGRGERSGPEADIPPARYTDQNKSQRGITHPCCGTAYLCPARPPRNTSALSLVVSGHGGLGWLASGCIHQAKTHDYHIMLSFPPLAYERTVQLIYARVALYFLEVFLGEDTLPRSVVCFAKSFKDLPRRSRVCSKA
ncbi:hypothetical protein GGR52DRAFT_14604 [Hypoxylon sp. FL1284]|nr:hypothetical protein GGR52DRAFT_14604 [Hypoxylon sp. FL1284]